MCFRPAGVTIDLTCPNCGQDLAQVVNPNSKKCPYCKADLSELRERVAQVSTQQTADVQRKPMAPRAPMAPKTPMTPKAPMAPRAPQSKSDAE